MQIYSNHLDKPFDVAICLDRDKKRPWSVVSHHSKSSFSTVGRLLTFMQSANIFTHEACVEIIRYALYPAAWMTLSKSSGGLSNDILRGAKILFVEQIDSPVTDGAFIYVLDRNRARIIEITPDEEAMEKPNNYDRSLVRIRISSELW